MNGCGRKAIWKSFHAVIFIPQTLRKSSSSRQRVKGEVVRRITTFTKS